MTLKSCLAVAVAVPLALTTCAAAASCEDRYAEVSKVSELARKGDLDAARRQVAALREGVDGQSPLLQRQSAEMAEYALLHVTKTEPERRLALLDAIAGMDTNTIWGAAAVGLRKLEQDPTLRYEPPRTSVEPRPRRATRDRFAFDEAKVYAAVKRLPACSESSGDVAFASRLAVRQLHAVDEIGAETLAKVASREGGRAFVERFLNDAAWLEDFFVSGPIAHPSAAFERLDTLVHNCGTDMPAVASAEDAAGRSRLLRRLMTALALNGDQRTDGELIATALAYREIVGSGRFHALALKSPVAELRWVVNNGHGAEELLYFNRLPDAAEKVGATAHRGVAYRKFNFLGESVQHRFAYYEPWFLAGWNPQIAAFKVGGVCGAVSKIGALRNNAWLLPSMPCSEPKHCAYAVTDSNGMWRVANGFMPYTTPLVRFGDFRGFAQLHLMKTLYKTERPKTCGSELWRFVAESMARRKADASLVDAAWTRAAALQPKNVLLWQSWWRHLVATEASDEALRAWADRAGAGLADTRDVLWDVLTPYFTRLAAKSPDAAAAEMARFHAMMRTDRVKVAEEMDYTRLLKAQAKLLGAKPSAMVPVLAAALRARRNDGRYFTTALKFGLDYVKEHPDLRPGFDAMVKDVWSDALAAGDGAAPDFSPLIRSASDSRDIASFRQAVEMQDRLHPVATKGVEIPPTRYGGTLVSAKGMLTISSHHDKDDPSRYARALDATPMAHRVPALFTGATSEAWALVTLPGEAMVRGLVLANDFAPKVRLQQVPLEVYASADGQAWERIGAFTEATSEFALDLTERPVRARYVKVVRKAAEDKRVFRLNKILVYGQAQY